MAAKSVLALRFGTSSKKHWRVSRQIPPKTQTCGSTRPTLFFRFVNILSSISRRSQRPVLHLQFYPTIVGSSN
jgi:hypothetical protein